jgi:hypothetical protein
VDFFLVGCEQLRWENICPERFVFAERHLPERQWLSLQAKVMKKYLQFDGVCVITLPCKHGHGVMEYGASTLYALIQPACSILLLVDWDGEGLTATVVYAIDQGHVEFVWVLGEVVGAGHA